MLVMEAQAAVCTSLVCPMSRLRNAQSRSTLSCKEEAKRQMGLRAGSISLKACLQVTSFLKVAMLCIALYTQREGGRSDCLRAHA